MIEKFSDTNYIQAQLAQTSLTLIYSKIYLKLSFIEVKNNMQTR